MRIQWRSWNNSIKTALGPKRTSFDLGDTCDPMNRHFFTLLFSEVNTKMVEGKEGNKIEASTLAKDNTFLFEIAPSRH